MSAHNEADRGERTAVCRHQEGAGASGQAGQKQVDHPPVATRSSRRYSTRASTSHTAHAPRESRAAARATPASGELSSRNPHPQQQARPLARLRAQARFGVRDGEARLLSRRARARRSGRRHTHAVSECAAGGRRGTTSTTTPPACVRACGLRARVPTERADPASCDVAQRACAASPRDRAHLSRPPAEGGRAERCVTTTKIHVHTYIRVLSWVVAPTCAMYPASLVLVRLA